jgi:hypothetical protein
MAVIPADKQIERERKKHERLIAKLLDKARRRQEQAEADYLFVMGIDHRAPWSERDRASLIVKAFFTIESAYTDLVKLLSSRWPEL